MKIMGIDYGDARNRVGRPTTGMSASANCPMSMVPRPKPVSSTPVAKPFLSGNQPPTPDTIVLYPNPVPRPDNTP